MFHKAIKNYFMDFTFKLTFFVFLIQIQQNITTEKNYLTSHSRELERGYHQHILQEVTIYDKQ